MTKPGSIVPKELLFSTFVDELRTGSFNADLIVPFQMHVEEQFMEAKLEIKAALQARFRRTKTPGNRGQSMSVLIMANQSVATPAAAGKKTNSTNVESSASEED